MSAKLQEVEIVVRPDEDPDTSYLEQDGFEDRLQQYNDGDFSFVGVQARAEILLSGGILQTITSPGLWGIESDSGEEYIRGVADDEVYTLSDMLDELAVSGADALGPGSGSIEYM